MYHYSKNIKLIAVVLIITVPGLVYYFVSRSYVNTPTDLKDEADIRSMVDIRKLTTEEKVSILEDLSRSTPLIQKQ